MREWIARGIVVLTFAMIVGLASVFAIRHNARGGDRRATLTAARPTVAENRAAAPAPMNAEAARGQAIFSQQGCEACHSVGGRGNPRRPLDGVGRRRDSAALRAWMLGDGTATAGLSPSALRQKERYREMPEADVAALVAYLTTLRAADQEESP